MTTATLAETAERIGQQRWLEERGFAALGTWSTDEVGHRHRAVFAAHARHHAERADWLRDRYPNASGFDVDAATVAPDDAAEVIEALETARTSNERVAAALALADVLRQRYERQLARTSSVADGELRRTISLALHDLAAHLDELHSL